MGPCHIWCRVPSYLSFGDCLAIGLVVASRRAVSIAILMMIIGVYATLGVFLIRASRHPRSNLSLIWFTIWSSLVHAGIMTVQSVSGVGHTGHLVGDVPALVLIAVVLAVLVSAPQRA
jgi:hypothetical protein